VQLVVRARGYRLCYDSHANHEHALTVVAATYAAKRTQPWNFLVQTKFEELPPKTLRRHEAAIAAALLEVVEETAPAFLEGMPNVTVSLPSSRDLIRRCFAEAGRHGWPNLTFDDRLVAEDRPKQTDLDSAGERQQAAQDKYAFEGDLTGCDVLLLDDVYTTGYSMHDAARAVRAAGAVSVGGVVYARRVYPEGMALYREIRGA
jgi:phosphoribosylpyrophosphate synthetase